MTRCGIIKPISKGKYTFPFKNPFTIETLDKVYKTYQNLNKQYNSKYQMNKKVESVEKPVITEEAAIKYLKSLGYKIQKPVVTYEEV